MTKEFWTLSEVVEIFEVQEGFIEKLEEEEVLCPVTREEAGSKVFTTEDLEKLRLAKILVEDMGVNLPGVDIILRMRQDMIEMRRQFDAILEALARRVRETYAKGS
ncbi:MAG: MerR family transcriptional regulator [Deltaproteobacteria bacterium]|nr:MerR family transcriptional regulator [Deltaproteobacteria bacterium]MBW2017600.1 MerR family transcriptional regulator [Deltaproteobacteria bacterium]MBW2129084.1 MerR family transcriptional regulator [Deltaproteobacteria bacterium]MBW2305002.1 MerR family transcriptional regulator [Deltaproteobacteria bacterium]